jgi:hypothetical protein
VHFSIKISSTADAGVAEKAERCHMRNVKLQKIEKS